MAAKSLKSQVTMLMVVGLTLFIIISLVLYLSKSTIKKQSQQGIKKTHETAIEMQPVKEFVSKCLDKLGKDAVVLLGQQGGYIYTSQGGTLIDYAEKTETNEGDEGRFFVKHNGLNVPYDIAPQRFATSKYASEVPDYPWKSFPYETAASDEEIFDGIFGISNLPPLNSSEGPNSIQTQIESFIDNNMADCIDTDIFQKQFDIAISLPKTSIVIGSSDISIKSRILMIVINPATKESAEFSDFSSNFNIRLKDVYFYAKELVENDIKNIKFDIGSVNNSRGSMSAKVSKNIFSNDDMIVIKDEESLIYGRAYEFVFARRNRAPALHYIKKNAMEFPLNYEITESELLQNTTLKAYDPDEDNYTFNITPSLPLKLEKPRINFKVEVNDRKLSDYQIIIVDRT